MITSMSMQEIPHQELFYSVPRVLRSLLPSLLLIPPYYSTSKRTFLMVCTMDGLLPVSIFTGRMIFTEWCEAKSTKNFIFGRFCFPPLSKNHLLLTSLDGATYTCGSLTLSAPGDQFDDGSGASNYTNNLDCSWLIQPTGGFKEIVLTFLSFSLQGNDFLYVYNGTSTSAPLLGTFTGHTLPSTITSTSPALFIVFTTDSSGTYRSEWFFVYRVRDQGWTLRYDTVWCTGTTLETSPSASFSDGSGPSYNYIAGLDCTWIIQPYPIVISNLAWKQ